ncbi:S8 family serine peptidase [Paracoccus zhejiangensis]|uniref:Peptidase S8/S53 domain-containing protein n=1 Tax=Paracoccus zhejiangensis TaxID=1077935 RepID=A0A2H5F4T4_9RHOB|nr:S8 family serine peptidase [Paracoccus zhejiangensis]AUH66547.1 hypothetical protein CX676_19760 [Paracoccus zhejiangensis]
MDCEWILLNSQALGSKTPYADWAQEIRPEHLKHRFPSFIVPNADASEKVADQKVADQAVMGTFELPHFRPVYVRLKGKDSTELEDNAKTCLGAAGKIKSPWPLPIILLDRHASDTLFSFAAGTTLPDEARFFFIYTLEWWPFPLANQLEELRTGPYVPGLSLRSLLNPGVPVALPTPAPAAPAAPPTVANSPVVTAIIDAEIGIANARFRAANGGTRIRHFWRQRQETLAGLTDLMIGREFSATAINLMLNDSNGDERLFYDLLRSGDYGSAMYPLMEDEALRLEDDRTQEGPGDEGFSWSLELARRLEHMLSISPPVNGVSELVRFHPLPGANSDPERALGVVKELLEEIAGTDRNNLDRVAQRLILAEDLDRDKGIPDKYRERAQQYAAHLRGGNYDTPARERPVGFRAGHGTHILDIAAGFPPDDAPGNRPIVAVELPEYVIEDTSGARLEVFVLIAMQRILDWVDNWENSGRAVPVVVNISLANAAGPKDGTGFLESRLEYLARKRSDHSAPTKVVIAAGNDYRTRMSGAFALDTHGGSETVEWRVPPGDQSASFLEIRPNSAHDLELTIVTPSGEEITLTEAGGFDAVLVCNGARVGRVYPSKEGDQRVITFALRSTLELDADFLRAPSGTYCLTFTNTGNSPLSIKLGIQRDDTLSGYPAYGKQSYLDHSTLTGRDPRTRKFDLPAGASPVSRQNTISAFATKAGEDFIVVGAAMTNATDDDDAVLSPEGRATTYTGSGGAIGTRFRPDLSAVAEDGAATPGQRASGVYSGSSVLFSGSSTATAHVTRALVDLYSATPNPGSKDEILVKVLSDTEPPDPRLGIGVLGPPLAPGRRPRRRY